MLYKTHLLTSVTAGTALAVYTDMDISVITLAGVAFGCLLPDIDEDGSYIGRKVKVLSKAIKSVFGHRGFTHSLLATFLVFLPYLWLNSSQMGQDPSIFITSLKHLFFGVGLGYLFHILEDMFSKTGVPLFWFFISPTKGKIKIPIYRTGKVGERVIFALSSVFFCYLLYQVFISMSTL